MAISILTGMEVTPDMQRSRDEARARRQAEEQATRDKAKLEFSEAVAGAVAKHMQTAPAAPAPAAPAVVSPEWKPAYRIGGITRGADGLIKDAMLERLST